MPGIFGGTGCSRESLQNLRRQYTQAWGTDCEAYSDGDSSVGGHAFRPESALCRQCGSFATAVDGDRSAYRKLARWANGEGEPLFELNADKLDLAPHLTANVAALHRKTGVLHLGSDWSGAFPLYYTCWKRGLMFANLLRPLALVTEAEADRVGTLQMLRQGYIYGNRTPFQEVYRLRPGEGLRFDPRSRDLEVTDRSMLWVGDEISDSDGLVDRCLEELDASVGDDLGDARRTSVMMSGGWDSRTLLAAIIQPRAGSSGDGVRGYSHGDVESRELNLVSSICEDVGVACSLEPLGRHILNPELIRRGFERTGVAIFPHWHHAARQLASDGSESVMSGVFGEVLGGHYGRTMTADGIDKVSALAEQWLGIGRRRTQSGNADPVAEARSRFALTGSLQGKHWYLENDFEASIDNGKERINADLDAALKRLARRGIRDGGRLTEALITEHRGSRYIAAQAASLRAEVDVSLPFADRALLHLASRISPRAKLHNSLNRRIIQELEPRLLDYPMAATLVPASYPLLLQEMSRAARKVWEEARWKTFFLSEGRASPPRLGWVNFEFMRDGETLHGLADDLRLDLWDKTEIRKRIEEIVSLERPERLHPYFDQFGKIMTVDLLFR